MKLSASANFLFGEMPFLDRFAALAEAGFHGVEIQFLEAKPEDVAQAARAAGLSIRLLNLDMGDLLSGGPGLSGVPGREAEFADALNQGLAAAEVMGAPLLHLGPSLIPEGVSREACLASYAHNVETVLATDAVSAGRILPTLEPMNAVDMPRSLFTDVRDAEAWLRQRFDGRIGLQFDCYHVAKGGADLLSTFQDLAERCAHVQFSDTPSRQEPGIGEQDFEAFFAAVRRSRYDGWLGAEYFPTRPVTETLQWMHWLE